MYCMYISDCPMQSLTHAEIPCQRQHKNEYISHTSSACPLLIMHALLKHIRVITELYKHVTLRRSVTGRTRRQTDSLLTYSHSEDILGMYNYTIYDITRIIRYIVTTCIYIFTYVTPTCRMIRAEIESVTMET